MVTLAHLIVSSLNAYANCLGKSLQKLRLPEDISVIDGEGNNRGQIQGFSSNGVAAFISDDCPVSNG